jgi:hypothetical protein
VLAGLAVVIGHGACKEISMSSELRLPYQMTSTEGVDNDGDECGNEDKKEKGLEREWGRCRRWRKCGHRCRCKSGCHVKHKMEIVCMTEKQEHCGSASYIFLEKGMSSGMVTMRDDIERMMSGGCRWP